MSLTALDYEEIRQVLTRYCHSLDFQDWDAFVACFTEDGTFEAESTRSDLDGRQVGHAALREFGKAVASYCEGHVRHSSISVLIEGDGENARARSYCLITRDYGTPHGLGQGTPRSEVITSGVYDDVLVKQDGRWAIRSRRFSYDGLPLLDAAVGQPIGYGPTA